MTPRAKQIGIALAAEVAVTLLFDKKARAEAKALTRIPVRVKIAWSVLRGAPVAYKLTIRDGALTFPPPTRPKSWWNRPTKWVYGCTFSSSNPPKYINGGAV